MAAAPAAHPVAAAGLQESDFFLVEYAGYPNVWHELLVVLAPDGASQVCTLTPNDDSYEEDLFAPADVRRRLPCDGGRMGAHPVAAAGGHVTLTGRHSRWLSSCRAMSLASTGTRGRAARWSGWWSTTS